MFMLVLAAVIPITASAPAVAEPGVDVLMGLKWQIPAIEVKLNGSGPYWFILDSGAGPYLMVDSDLADELRLPVEGKNKVGDPSNPHALSVEKVYVERVEVGSVVYDGVEALKWNQPLYSEPDRPRGIVGVGLFGGMLVTFDYPAGRVRLQRGDLPEADGVTVLDAPMTHNVPTVEIDVAGKRLMARLDTGSTGFLSLPRDLAGQLPVAGEPIEVGRAHTVNRQYSILASTLKGVIRLGGLKIENPMLHFMNSLASNVGTDLLRALVMTIDRKNQRVRLVSGGRPIAPSNHPRLGLLSAAMKDGRMPVEGVTPGSTAEKAGLRAGDAVVKINGRPVAPMKPGDLAMALRATPLRLTLLRDGHEIEVDVSIEPETR